MSTAAPSALRSPLNRICQYRQLTKAVGAAPGVPSETSSTRPSAGRTPSAWKKFPVTHTDTDWLAANGRLSRERNDAGYVREDRIAVLKLLVALQSEHIQRRIAGILPGELHKASGIANW